MQPACGKGDPGDQGTTTSHARIDIGGDAGEHRFDHQQGAGNPGLAAGKACAPIKSSDVMVGVD
jgi:molybdopterin-binding protein